MKKGLLIVSIFVAGIIACSKKVVPATTATKETNTNPVATAPVVTPPAPKTEEVAPPKEEIKPASKPEVAGANDTDPTLVKGRAIYTGKCIKCHAAYPVESFTATRWDGILRSMIPKAKLAFDESAQVTAFVKAHAKK